MMHKNVLLVFLVAIFLGLGLSGCFEEPNASEEVCNNTCQYAFDGECDDGGPNSQYSLCDCGTDCADCGTREVSDNDCLGGGSSSSSSSGSSSSGSSSSGGSSSSSSSGSSSSSSSSGGPVFGTVSDNDGNTYETVVIGSQTWMAENMKTTKTRNGQSIPAGFTHYTSPMYPEDNDVLAMTWKDNDPGLEDVYGGLYNFYTANRICPSGWHLPTKQDWEILKAYVGSNASKLQKSGAWPYSTSNETGFSAVPNDRCSNLDGTLYFQTNTNNAVWWSDYVDYTSVDGYGFSGYSPEGFTLYETPVYNPTTVFVDANAVTIGETPAGGLPCRCVKD